MADKKFELGDYVEVKDRIARFYELFGGGRLVTDKVRILTAPDGSQRVMVRALAYRSADDPLPGVGHSWMGLPGTTPYTRGSELENAETSAWGRAIGSLGILILGSIATSNEIDSKADSTVTGAASGQAAPVAPTETETHVGPVTRSGLIVRGAGSNSDLQYRGNPDGTHRIGFLLEVGDGKPRPQVVIDGELGGAMYAVGISPDVLNGQSIEVEGEVYEVRVPGRKMFYRIRAERFEYDGMMFPASEVAPGQEVLELA